MNDRALEHPNDTQPTPDQPIRAPLTRRDFLRGTRNTLLATGTAAAGGYGFKHYVLDAPEHYDFALLKMDPEQQEMGLVHRRMSTGNAEGMIEPAKTSLEGLSPGSLAGNGLESLIVSPELTLKALSRERGQAAYEHSLQHRHDPQEIKLERTTRNLYMPYHLFQDASDFGVSLRTDHAGKQFLRISIFGKPEAEDVPFTQDVTSAAETTKNSIADTFSGLGEAIGGLVRSEAEQQAAERARHEAIRARESARPHPQVRPKFMIELEYQGPASIPDLHFFNGHTIDTPTDHVRREEIAAALAADPQHGLKLITNNGLVCDSFVNGGVCVPSGIHHTDASLEKATHDARLHATSRPEDGVLKSMWGAIKRFAVEDNKLNENEMGALVMATQFQQAGLDQRLGTGWRGLVNRAQHKLSDAPDQQLGR
ncbi:MAG: hypothetical protein DI582_01765 [Azospirillum brasilense]|nr:MAG: hypothetical protein DI582_01765 [Azospirillum brasilense]